MKKPPTPGGQPVTVTTQPDGLRSSKTVGGSRTDFIWDGQNMVAELNGGTVTDSYLFGVGLIYSDRSGYYTFNAHGDVTGLTDSTGALTQSYHYDAFGEEQDPREDDPNPYRYAGEYFDRETGDIYLRARYYNPSIGRFSQTDRHWNTGNMIYGDDPLQLTQYTIVPDILSIGQSSNLYAYGLSNPVLYIDKNGFKVYVYGAAVAAQNGYSVGGSTAIVFDEYGNIAVWVTYGAGAVFFGAGIGKSKGILNLDTIYDLKDVSLTYSASVSVHGEPLYFGTTMVHKKDGTLAGSLVDLGVGAKWGVSCRF